MMLDLEAVRLFVASAQFGNLTRAAEACGTVQPVVSHRLKSLESRLGRTLLERSPRHVRLTEAGTAFLPRAHALLEAHAAALDLDEATAAHVTIGMSDHALGGSFDRVLGHLRAALPAGGTIDVRIGHSHAMRALYEEGALDMAVVRREAAGAAGEILGEDILGWRAPRDWTYAAGPLPLVTLAPPCGVRSIALNALDRAGIAWREAFVGGSCMALLAAVRAGLGVAPMGRIAADGCPDRGAGLGLPALSGSQIVLLARTSTPVLTTAARAVAAGVRESLR